MGKRKARRHRVRRERHIKHGIRHVTVTRPRPLDGLLFAGFSVLASLAVGASPDKALDFGIEALRFMGAKFTYLEPELEEDDFMLGLA